MTHQASADGDAARPASWPQAAAMSRPRGQRTMLAIAARA